MRSADGVGERVDRFFEADLDAASRTRSATDYDIVLAADVLEHVRDPAAAPDSPANGCHGGTVIAQRSELRALVPAGRVALGRFDYDRRGILDADHVRFFTRHSFEHLAADTGFAVRRRETIGIPLEVVDRGGPGSDHVHSTTVGKVERIGVDLWPTMFGFQFLYELQPSGVPAG